MKQRGLCVEYHKKIKYVEKVCNNEDGRLVVCRLVVCFEDEQISYNYRNLKANYPILCIYDKYLGRIGKLCKNYR